MGVGENAALFRQFIHMGREGLRVAAEESGPIIEIVDADHQNVWPIRILGLRLKR